VTAPLAERADSGHRLAALRDDNALLRAALSQKPDGSAVAAENVVEVRQRAHRWRTAAHITVARWRRRQGTDPPERLCCSVTLCLHRDPVGIGSGRIAALHDRASTLHQIH
jgi:hypothetical protein